MTIDTTNMCSHLQRKLYDGEHRAIRELERMADYIINVEEALYEHKHDK